MNSDKPNHVKTIPSCSIQIHPDKDLTLSFSTYFTQDDLSIQHDYQRWSKQEDSLLYHAVMDVSGGIPPIRWKRISMEYFVGLRSESQCRYRWNRVIHPQLGVEGYNQKDSKLEDSFGIQSSSSSSSPPPPPRMQLDYWSREDQVLLLKLVQQWGRTWKHIATYFPGRDSSSCQNKWYNLRQSEQRRRIRQFKQQQKQQQQQQQQQQQHKIPQTLDNVKE
jgi:hypothetical protein